MPHHRALVWKIARPLARLYWRLRRPLTAGVRGMVFNEKGRVLLVRHTYIPGWYLPGGGVERGETMLTSLRRELEEEVGVMLTGEARLHGLYANFREFKSDHVALYVVADGDYEHRPRRSPEIAESAFFAPNALPEGITGSTARRIEEVVRGIAPDELW
ncbi:NUDIX domain-containing protein [Parvibaculum sp.]|jgi:8-oxo-dGTP pyrophosphatase MutT (NUDIX family)|uniref:NUDIX domain-containing protein n=1 Tax=Parvibaculum sp. TaxID=2024848 RepID=UPI001B101EBE|nr:NUDIX domain-containing protein [Parvibaculum sp.]MBO6635287.1 NUDIX domain-containing protein [Parvibaculum sp.]MBO6679598.1 NUDIX domain-containing protein [Parvibaculum sp.]MBO6684893.1 NUDIX domain-containing protein [Parvibaculum sp.]